jgi:hypothetical protein
MKNVSHIRGGGKLNLTKKIEFQKQPDVAIDLTMDSAKSSTSGGN